MSVEKVNSMDKLERLFLDQHLHGVFSRLIGRYQFSTEKIGLSKYTVSFLNKEDTNLLNKVNLIKDGEIVMSFDVRETLNYKTLSFEVSDKIPFNFMYFCMTFKFFYQHIKQNTKFESLVLRTTRYKSYMFKKLFGFSMIGWDKNHFYLQFSTKDGLQNIWDEYYGTSLDENLYNFILPADAGGFVPGNIKLKKPNTAVTAVSDFRKTEKKYHGGKKPRAEIKIGYGLHTVSIRDLSEYGISFVTQLSDEHPEPPQIQLHHIYNIWVTDSQLNMNWTSLTVQIVWQKDNVFGCRIRENAPAWKNFIRMMDIKHYERLTFEEKPNQADL